MNYGIYYSHEKESIAHLKKWISILFEWLIIENKIIKIHMIGYSIGTGVLGI